MLWAHILTSNRRFRLFACLFDFCSTLDLTATFYPQNACDQQINSWIGHLNVSIFFSFLLFFLLSFFIFFSVVFNATMSSLPGTVPRMMRPAPGQNYPRTGFPLEGRSLTVALNSLSDSGRFCAEAEKNASLIWRLFKQIFCIKH